MSTYLNLYKHYKVLFIGKQGSYYQKTLNTKRGGVLFDFKPTQERHADLIYTLTDHQPDISCNYRIIRASPELSGDEISELIAPSAPFGSLYDDREQVLKVYKH